MIDCSGTATWNSGAGFIPITAFSGSLDGGYNIVSDITINRTTGQRSAIFGTTSAGAVIKNVNFKNVAVTTAGIRSALLIGEAAPSVTLQNVILSGTLNANFSNPEVMGGVAGLMYNGNLDNVHLENFTLNVTNTTTNPSSYALHLGGIVAEDYESTITNSSVTGTFNLSGNLSRVGGFAGLFYGSQISKSFSNIAINTSSNSVGVGGFVGMPFGNSTGPTITDTYSRGNVVSGTTYTGGYYGFPVNNSSITIKNSYSTGTSSTTTGFGGFGDGGNAGTYQNNFWDTQTSGLNNGYSATGKTTTAMKNVSTFTDTATTGLTTAWDFVGTLNNDTATNDIWQISPTQNNGYPTLTAFNYMNNTYTLSYDTQGGSTAPSSTTPGWYQVVTLPAAPTKTGYVFTGWNTAANGSGGNYNAGESFAYGGGQNITLYAQWIAPIVSFDGQGASSPSSIMAPAGSTITLPAALTQSGYFFVEWNTISDGSGTGYAANANYMVPNSDITLYAIWSTTPVNPVVLLSVTPIDNSVNVPISSNLILIFSEPVEWNDQDMEIRKTSDNSLVAYLDISPSSSETTGDGTNTITINPSNDLDYSTEYYILITNQNFKSVASGNLFTGISNATEWSFTTAASPTTPQISGTNSSSGGMAYICTDPTAINYSNSSFGKSNSSICQYATKNVDTPSVTTILNSGVCSADLLITNNMKQGDKNGKYSSYNKGTVTQVKLLQQHINRILAAQYKQAAGPIDGIYGPMTKQGVQRLQVVLKDILYLDLGPAGVDGIIGGYTKEAINSSCGK